VALHVLREKRREIEKDDKSYWPYLPWWHGIQNE
jgi:hypothetical protein